MGQPIVNYESGQTSYDFEAMTDSGDNTTFAASFSPVSQASGAAPTIAPYGLATGGVITPASGNDLVDVAAMSLVAPGMTGADADGVVAVSADTDIDTYRGITSDTHMITSITVDSSGAVASITGVDHTAFATTRGDPGAPPFIPVGSVEIGQVRTTSVSAAAVVASEIKQTPNLHQENTGYPTYTVDYATGEVTFTAALELIHTASVPKKVYITGATPLFAPLGYSSDWSPAKATVSSSSDDTYDGPVATSSSSLGTASFTAKLDNGVTDNIVGVEGDNIWIEYLPDRDASLPKQLTQGTLSSAWTQQAGGGKVNAAYTVAAEVATVNVTS
jgi:hypothetical protein